MHLSHLVDKKTVITKRAVVMSSARLDPISALSIEEPGTAFT